MNDYSPQRPDPGSTRGFIPRPSPAGGRASKRGLILALAAAAAFGGYALWGPPSPPAARSASAPGPAAGAAARNAAARDRVEPEAAPLEPPAATPAADETRASLASLVALPAALPSPPAAPAGPMPAAPVVTLTDFSDQPHQTGSGARRLRTIPNIMPVADTHGSGSGGLRGLSLRRNATPRGPVQGTPSSPGSPALSPWPVSKTMPSGLRPCNLGQQALVRVLGVTRQNAQKRLGCDPSP